MENRKSRSAGILLHITSLPSRFGIGDLGPEAYKFADFLSRSIQHYWQILPLNPTEGGSMHSPYSSHSSMAGNILLISPELLEKEGLLSQQDLNENSVDSSGKVDFPRAEEIKEKLLNKAYDTYSNGDFNELKVAYQNFLGEESYWINDYALYKTLKIQHKGAPWYEWDDKFKKRNPEALKQFSKENAALIDKVKWQQFIFTYQWKRLKQYCHQTGVLLFGDLPFYISHDSVDVWSHPEIFDLEKDGKMKGVAGVPPDYFNEDGQLWGMPVFRWDVLKEQGYEWWVKRIKKNIQYYDKLRLDHFRAFSEYWEVPAEEKTARNGSWKPGPGSDFFMTLNDKLGKLPFIAEDLGEIDAPVYELRDSFDFPGMKVIQFAFGNDINVSPHIPHNYSRHYIAYTGTHDNNTTVGWYTNDIDDFIRNNLNRYTGTEINENNVHKELIRLVYQSVAMTAIIPMQDILGLDGDHRMNMPATLENNWVWRMEDHMITQEIEDWLKEMIYLYNRG